MIPEHGNGRAHPARARPLSAHEDGDGQGVREHSSTASKRAEQRSPSNDSSSPALPVRDPQQRRPREIQARCRIRLGDPETRWWGTPDGVPHRALARPGHARASYRGEEIPGSTRRHRTDDATSFIAITRPSPGIFVRAWRTLFAARDHASEGENRISGAILLGNSVAPASGGTRQVDDSSAESTGAAVKHSARRWNRASRKIPAGRLRGVGSDCNRHRTTARVGERSTIAGCWWRSSGSAGPGCSRYAASQSRAPRRAARNRHGRVRSRRVCRAGERCAFRAPLAQ